MEKTGEDFYSSALIQITELKTEKPELNEILEFYEQVLKAQGQVKQSFQAGLGELDIECCKKRNHDGLPLLQSEDIEVDQDLLHKIVEEIHLIIHNKSAETLPASLNCASLVEQKKVLIKGLLEDEGVLERFADDLKINYPIFYFLVKHSFSPFISTYAEKLQEIVDSSNWLRGCCPVCGKEPLIARLEEETGTRTLFCSLCHSEWLFKRLACPFCENDDQENLRYFFVEDDEAHRIDVCDKCKRYIKTIDSRKIESVGNLFIEYLSTLALDIVADKEGFKGGDVSLFREK